MITATNLMKQTSAIFEHSNKSLFLYLWKFTDNTISYLQMHIYIRKKSYSGLRHRTQGSNPFPVQFQISEAEQTKSRPCSHC